MRINVSEPELCVCHTCVQHRTFNTQETEPGNVIGSSVTSVPVSSGPVPAALGSTSDQSSSPITSGTEPPPPVTTTSVVNTQETEPSNVIDSFVTAVPVSSGPVQALGSTSDQTSSPIRSGTGPPPPVTTSVNPEPVVSTRFEFPPAVTSKPAQALAPTASGSMQSPAFGFSAFATHRPSLLGASAVNGSSPISFAPPAPVQALGTTTTSSPLQTSSPFSFPPPAAQPLGPTCPAFGCPSPFAASGPSMMLGPMQAPPFGYGSSIASTSSTPSPLRWGSMQANGPNTSTTPFSFSPAQDSGKTSSAFPPPSGYSCCFARPDVGVSPPGCFGENHFSSPLGPTTEDFAKTGVCAPKNPFGSYLHPGFGVRYPSNPFGQNPQANTPVSLPSSFWGGVGNEQGSRYPRYAPTPDLTDSGGQGKMLISISASNSHGRKSHEELRWEDYKNGDKGGFGWFPPANTSPFNSSTSLFATPSIPERRTVGPTHHGNMIGTRCGYTIPTTVQRPHEPAAVSSPSSGCTTCGAKSSSSPSSHLGLNGTTNPPSSLPGLFLSTYGSCPLLLFGTPNLAAYGTTTSPAVQAYAIVFGTNFAAQGTTTTPAVQAYPMMFGTPNLAAQGTTTPAVQPYPSMFGAPNLAGQGTTTTTPAAHPYPMMFGIPNLAGQGTTTPTPAVQPFPMMFGTQNLAAQGTTTPTAAVQPFPTMSGTANFSAQGTTTPAVQPYAMMFGTPTVGGAQGITPAAQAYPVNGLTLLPFAAMSLQ